MSQLLYPVATSSLPGTAAADVSPVPLEQVSVADRGGPGGNADSSKPSISADGRWVAFASTATNLDDTSPDTNGVSDVFVFDRLNGVTRRISPPSVSNCVTSCLRGSFDPSISADGSRVAFVSDQRLVPEDDNDLPDVYVRTLPSGPTVLVSSDFQSAVRFAVGGHSPSISGNGHFVAFVSPNPFISTSDATRCTTCHLHVLPGDPLGSLDDDVFEQDVTDLTIAPTLISAQPLSTPTTGDEASGEPSVSNDGSVVAFTSVADNLVAPDDNGAGPTVFRRSVPSATTTILSTGESGRGGGQPSISADGNRVAFTVGEPVATTPSATVPVSTTGSTPVTITNSGGGILFVSGFTLVGSPDFHNLGALPGSLFCDDAELLAGDSCSVNITFTPGSPPETATLTFDYNTTPAPVAIQTSVNLIGSTTGPETVAPLSPLSSPTTRATGTSTSTTTTTTTRVPTTAAPPTTRAPATATTVPTTGPAVTAPTAPATIPPATTTSTTVPFTIPVVTVPQLPPSAAQPLNVNSTPSPSPASTSTTTTTIASPATRTSPVVTSPPPAGGAAAGGAPSGTPLASPAAPTVPPSGTALSPPPLGALDMNGVADVYVADVAAATITPVSTRDAPCASPCVSQDAVKPSLSADGGTVAFSSASPELVPNDTNGSADVFERDLVAPGAPIVRVSETSAGGQTTAGSSSLRPSVSGDGRDIVFDSDAENLLSGGAAGVAAGPPSPDPGPVPANLLTGPVLPVVARSSPVSTTPTPARATTPTAGTAQPASGPPPTTTTSWPFLSSGGAGAVTAAQTTTTSTWPLLSNGQVSTATTWPLLSAGGARGAGPVAPSVATTVAPAVAPTPASAPTKATGTAAPSVVAAPVPAPLVPAAPSWPLLTSATVAPQATASEVIRDIFARELLPVPVFSPTTQDFGASEVEVPTASQTFTLTNTGPGQMVVTQGVIQGANPGDFAITGSTCDGVTLHIGESCTLMVAFTPTATGVRQASLAIVSDAPGGSPSVALQGTGTSPPFTVTPNPVDFGSVGVGFSSTRDITISNGGAGTHAVGPLSLTGPNASEFPITATTCSGSLPPGYSCTVTVAFNPSAPGPSSATLNGTFGGTPFAVPLTGTGVAGTLTIVPNPVDFGSVAGGDPAVSNVVTVTNQGPGVVTVTGVSVASGASDFTIGADACTGQTLLPTQSCTVQVGFTPAGLGTRSGQLSVQSTAASVATVPLTGTGTSPPFTVDPNPVDFGPVGVGIPSTTIVEITNSGTSPHTVGPLSVTGPNASDFQITATTCSGPLSPGNTCTVTLVFTPTTAGPSSATLMATFGGAAAQFAVPITGSGVAGTLTIAPNPADFGSAAIGDPPVDKVFTLTNGGPGVVLITGVTVTSGGPDFTVGANACTGQTLLPTQSCTVHVGFSPTAVGARAGQLSVQSTAASVATAALTGTGTNPAFTVDPTAVDFGSVGVGLPSSKIVTITNNSAGTHTVGPLSVTGPNASDFAITASTCNAPLPPGASCTVTLALTPGTAGASNATLTGTFGPVPFAVPLTGTGLAGMLSITPSPVAFGPAAIDDAPMDATVTVTNEGPGVVLVSGVMIANGAPDFAVSQDTCTAKTLLPTQSCTVHVLFAPVALGARQGQLTVQSTAASVATVALTGTGTTPAFTFQPNPVDFGSVGVGLTSAMTVTITNSDTVPHTLGTPSLRGPNASDFAITASTCGNTPIPPGGSCTLTLALTPTAAGSSNAALTFGGAPAAFGVPLTGLGLAGTLSITPNPVDFGSVAVGDPPAHKVETITNSGPGVVVVTGVMVTNGGPDFSVSQDTCTGKTLMVTQSCTVQLDFKPSAVGMREGQLSVLSTAASVATAKLTGTGTNAAITVSPPSVDFGASPVGQAAPDQTVTLTSTSITSSPSLSIAGPQASNFRVVTTSCVGSSVGGSSNGTTCTLGIRFTPSADGARMATLTGTFGPTQTPFSVPLQGFGGVPPTTTTTTVTTPGATTTTTPGATTTTVGSTPAPAGTTTTTVAGGEPGSSGGGGGAAGPAGAGTGAAGASPDTGGASTGSGGTSPASGGTGPATPATAPVLVLSRPLGPPGAVTSVSGSGFLPNTTLQLRWVLSPDDPTGLVIDLGTVTTGADGTFADRQVLVFLNDPQGPRTLRADGGTDQVATADFLVTPATAQPSANLFPTHRTELIVRS